MKDRLHFLKTCLLILVCIAATASAFTQCYISGFGSLGTLSKTTGNQFYDQKFNSSQIDIQSLFNVTVDLYIYDDSDSPNAFATTSNSIYYDGLIAFGYNMLVSRLWDMNKGEYCVAGVLAHEFAHVLQIKMNCSLPGMQKELMADFLAGYYFGKRDFLANGLEGFALDLYSMGDYNFWDPQHHGTPDERMEAMLAGFGYSYLSIDEAYSTSIRYVTGELEPEQHTATCYNCSGSGQYQTTSTCNYCMGYGSVACQYCAGTGGGYAYGYNGYGQYGYWWYPCMNCGGNKGFICPNCQGYKMILVTSTCTMCGGSGKK